MDGGLKEGGDGDRDRDRGREEKLEDESAKFSRL